MFFCLRPSISDSNGSNGRDVGSPSETARQQQQQPTTATTTHPAAQIHATAEVDWTLCRRRSFLLLPMLGAFHM